MPAVFRKLPKVRTAFAGKVKEMCNRCSGYEICSERSVKNVKEDTDCCQWTPSKFKERSDG